MNKMVDKFKDNDQTAIIYDGKKYSYNELYIKIKEIESFIKGKIKSGEVVAILADYSFVSIALFFALYENKNIIAPITSTSKKEIDGKVKESFSTKIINLENENLVITNIKSEASHKIINDLQTSKCAGLILFSSGSTGAPKAMIHNLDTLVDSYGDKKQKQINMLVFLMFDHIGGINTMLNILSMNATMIIPQNRNADDICKLIEEYKIAVLPSSPTFLNLILINRSYEKYDLSSLRMITYGTETMPEGLLGRLKAVFSKVKFLQTFGTSETGIAATSSKSSSSTFMKIDDENLEYKIVDNELWLRSKTQILGYLNRSMESFTNDGWFKTGDLVELDNEGFIKIIGRNKEIINVGGQKVLPSEVESVLLGMDEIEDCLVYGEQNAITGQSVSCDVVLKSGVEADGLKILVRKFCKDKLDNFKIPTRVNVVQKTKLTERFKKSRIKG
ncbi:ANL family adenylate-forming protein [Campylobacter concisus]|uniref:Long-chain-fatty-acid--CoA ligase n=1 Tax=Campylobacter concisus UNSW2 TaxID=1242965 RepID=U2FM53_9BACT|nr:fatty acid--CoA ligase family protein [Campylobacter concisus]ERJ31727.1 Long-chain-fatty-acid--CoA ligase [Campylobacter concisus UNSW2]